MYVATHGHMRAKKKSRQTGVAEPASSYATEPHEVSVRMAKDQLSALLERAARGEEIIITSDGVPKATLSRYKPKPQVKAFEPDMAWLRSMPLLSDSTSAIRAERDV
ncbi:MAG: type II toxin-antitoxin system prevent-host-death family antitoxin [Candidatus Didemnitutus sp.]|nr:type II toxin-antitoxin system prevent-host-death family antitoxin [Candidatus Didemnitutus sp.]